MNRHPREIHDYEQLQARLRDVAATVGGYRRALIESGVPEGEAWESARKVEDRLTQIAIGDFEESERRRLLDEVTEELMREIGGS